MTFFVSLLFFGLFQHFHTQIVQSCILIFSPLQDASVQTILSSFTEHSLSDVQVVSCNECSISENVESFQSSSVSIRKSHHSRYLCTRSSKWERTAASLEEIVRIDLLNFPTVSQFDFDVILSAMSLASVIVYDTRYTHTMLIDVLSKVLLSTLSIIDIVNPPNSTLVVQRHLIPSQCFRNFSYLKTAVSPYSLSDTMKRELNDFANIRFIRNPFNLAVHNSICSSVLTSDDMSTMNHLESPKKTTTISQQETTKISGDGVFSPSTDNQRLLCMVYTISPRHQNVADQLSTWGHKCDGFIAWSNLTDESISIAHLHNVKIDGLEQYNEMWSKVQNIWSVVASSDLIDRFQYFYLAGDDVYVLVENLRRCLSSPYLRALSRDNTLPLYLGRRVPHNHYLFYHTGESGYILNAVAVRALVHHLKETQCFDELSISMEDVMVANCLRHSIGLEPLDSRDASSSERFHATNLSAIQRIAVDGNRYEGMVKNSKLGLQGVSTQSIVFHDMAGGQYMRCVDEYLNYL